MICKPGDLVRICSDDYGTDYQIGLVVEVIGSIQHYGAHYYRVLMSNTLSIENIFQVEIELKLNENNKNV